MRQFKRILCVLLLACLMVALAVPASAATSEQKVTLSIPCTVTVDVGKYGKVTVGGVTYTGATVKSFQVEPGTNVTFLITPSSGYTVSVLTLSGTNVLGDLKNGVYNVTVEHDETLVVRFSKGASPSPRPTPTPIWRFGPKTGDESRVGLWTVILILSLVSLFVLCRIIRKHRPGESIGQPENNGPEPAGGKTKE